MNSTRRFLLLALFLAYCSSGPLAFAQADPDPVAGQLPVLTPRTHEERERRYRADHKITIDVEVVDRAGQFISGLGVEDLSVVDNDQVRKIDGLRVVRGDLPAAHVHAILILDMLNNIAKNMAFERKGIERFLGQNHGHLDFPISVAVLSNVGLRISQPSREGTQLISELARLSEGSHVSTCSEEVSDGGLGDQSGGPSVVSLRGQLRLPTESALSKLAACENARFQISISQLGTLARKEADAPGRALVLWVGEGWPLLSGPEFAPDTRTLKQNLFDYQVELATALREAQITLHAISYPRSLRNAEPHGAVDRALIHGVLSPDQASAGGMALPVLAHETGGLNLEFSKDIAASIAVCLADAKSFYVLSFDSPPTSKGIEYHPIEVRASRPEFKVRTNSAYYAQP